MAYKYISFVVKYDESLEVLPIRNSSVGVNLLYVSKFYKIIIDEKSTIYFLPLHHLLPNDSEMPYCKKYNMNA